MAASTIPVEPALPWVTNREDRIFWRLLIVILILFMCFGLVLNSLTLPEVKQKKLIDVSPRLAKLILEKKKVKPPPKKEIPRIEEKKKEPEKKPEKKEPEKKKETPKPKKQAAREVAKQSGLIALSDELSDLRESFDLENLIELAQATGGSEAVEVATTTDLLTSQAKQSSGGITTNTLTRKTTTSELASRKTTAVESNIESKQATAAKAAKQSSGRVTKRAEDEIEQVFQKNKSGIFSVYNRALRKNPALQGKVVIELTIDPNGTVTNVKIVSSELNDKSLERKLVLKIKKFKFAQANVTETTVRYPIDFLPS